MAHSINRQEEVIAFQKNVPTLTAEELVALNYFVRATKQYNLWDKINVFYPFVGSSETSFGFNLKNLTANYITFFGDVSPANFIQNGLAHTSVISANLFAPSVIDNLSLSTYVNYVDETTVAEKYLTVGTGNQYGLYLTPNSPIGKDYGRITSTSSIGLRKTSETENYLGFRMVSRTSPTFSFMRSNNENVRDEGISGAGGWVSIDRTPMLESPSGEVIQIFGYYGGTLPTNVIISSVMIGDGFSIEESKLYYHIEQEFHRIIGRAV